METKKQVIVYVDGYNFYYGLKNGGPKWKRLYWLDIVKFFERMMSHGVSPPVSSHLLYVFD